MSFAVRVKSFLKEALGLRHPIYYYNQIISNRRLLKDKKKYQKKYCTDDVLDILAEIGLRKGDTLFIHSRWAAFYNYEGTSKELIDAILNYLGEGGTLAMPCFPQNQDPTTVFDINKTPSGAGLITEVFRRYPRVKRSINLNHSVCALGVHADFLTKEHHKSITSWDEFSPYYRLKECKAMILCLGTGFDLRKITSLHCVESILREDIFYYSTLFNEKVSYRYLDHKGEENIHTFLKRIGEIKEEKLASYFNAKELRQKRLSNLTISAIRADILIDKAVALGRQGITMYVKPKPKKKLFYRI